MLFFCRFIEHGEYKENQYGTSIEAIRSVQAKNKMCVVDVQPEVSTSCLMYIQMCHTIITCHEPQIMRAGSCIRLAHYVDTSLLTLSCHVSILFKFSITKGPEEAADSRVQAVCNICQTSCS